jgi:hypothetical protein
MFYLVNFIACENHLSPITDDDQSWAALSYFRENGRLSASWVDWKAFRLRRSGE